MPASHWECFPGRPNPADPMIETVSFRLNDQPMQIRVRANAIHDATGVRLLELPMTPERIKAALGESPKPQPVT